MFNSSEYFKKIDEFGIKFDEKKEENITVEKKLIESETKILNIKRERENLWEQQAYLM